MVNRIFKVILLFTPIAYCVGVHYYKFEVVFFQLTSMILIISSLFDTPKREFKIKKILTLFLGICMLSVVLHGFQIKNLSALINIFFGCIDVYILAVYSKDLKKCINWLMVGLGINALIFIGQWFGYSPFIDPKTIHGSAGGIIPGEYGGIIGNAPRFAAFITLVLPFISVWYLIPAIVLGFVLKEVGIIISVLIVFIAKTLIAYRNDEVGEGLCKFVLLFSLLSGAVLLYFYHTKILTSFSIRMNTWKTALEHIAQRPFFGFGLGTFNIADFGCSSFLQWIYGVGFLGLGFIVLCIKKIKWYLFPLLFLCLFEYPFEIPRLYPLLVFVIAYWAIEQKEERLWD
ncbi:hypothetical protein LCGC14_1841980 [marine sediment metagenome]|uniref:Uncharacterized protein n=1 Tax=marine sediment metagenome TaxID=412755 RepID=A0A0F9ISH8_9ZZZZ